MKRYCIRKMSPIVIVFALLVIIFITPTTLQPSLATANYTLVPSNQTTSTVVDKTTNVTLRGIFDDQGYPGIWNQLLQPALDELNRRHPDMNIELEYIEFIYPGTRNQILDILSKGESVDIISVDQIWLGEFAQRGLIENLTDRKSVV